MEVHLATQRLDHLGIVAGVCHEIELIKQIDTQVGVSRRYVSVGEAVQAMVLNALGFTSRALYLTPEYFANKPVDVLIHERLTATDLNDDSLGRALDILYERGVTEVFALVASHALFVYGIDSRFYHLDSTSFSVTGEYTAPSDDPQAVVITHGYSKDHRPDLKQVVVSLICTYQSSIPVWLEVLSGNSSDKTSFPHTIEMYMEQMTLSETPYFIADSALYSAENLAKLSQVYWISRVPETIKVVEEWYAQLDKVQMQPSAQAGYYFKEIASDYSGIPQRWLVVFSEAAYNREIATFQTQLEKQREQAEKQLWHLANLQFVSQEDAHQAVAKEVTTWRYHRVDYQLEEVPHYQKPGRPASTAVPDRIGYRLVGCVVEDKDAIEKAVQRKGKFILATNQLDSKALPAETLLAAYKGQASSVERGFRFLKDPLFFASSLFLDKPERIMALTMVMGLALLVYALAEHKLRTELLRTGQTVPNQVGKPTARPTMRWVFQLFEGIDLLLVATETDEKRVVLNLKPIHHQILKLLGPQVQKCYFCDS